MAKVRLAIRLILLLSLLGSILFINPAVASPDVTKWSGVNIPTEGKPCNWVLANGSDAQHLAMALDGTLYCYANPSGTSYTLFKSTDGGYSWSYIGEVEGEIVDIATAPDDASGVYYATSSAVYQSTDAGGSFILLPPNPGGAGSNNMEITSIDVARAGGSNIITVGTRDTDSLEYGGIYTLDESDLVSGWLDTNLGSYDVYAIAFSPNFAADQQLVAVVTDETDTLVTTRIGDGGWGEIIGDAKLDSVAVDTSAAIAFPDDYDASSEDYILFVAIDAGPEEGNVYKISAVAIPDSSVATDLNIGSAYGLDNVDVTSLTVTGNATTAYLLAGAAGSAQVYYTGDGGINWARSAKLPTGESKTYVLAAPDFSSSGRAYAATSGTESAFSDTTDSGGTWNQIGLIDITLSEVIDLAPSPNYGRDDTLFMLTWGSKHSLWRSLNGGARWERVFTSALADVDSLNLVELSPQYGSGSEVVFVAGSSGGNPALWKSLDSGQSFDEPKLTPFPISVWVWAVVNDNTLFVGSYDGSNGLVYRTNDSGSSYSSSVVVGNQPLNSIALSPDYDEDGVILVGNTNGWVYWSNDNGASFESLPPDATSPPLTGNITVVFDPQFSRNGVVYAASDTPDSDIYRFIIGESTEWESIDNTLPTDSVLGQLVVSAGGALYAINSQPIDTVEKEGGMERCLNPAYPPGPAFETVTFGLSDGATLNGLWLSGNQLWSIDTHNIKLMTYTDSLAAAVTLISPPNRAPGIGVLIGSTIKDVSLDWKSLGGATSYQWQLDYDADFSTVPIPLEGDTGTSSTHLPVLEPATTYYWRVRVTEPLFSPWSVRRSFTTSLGTPSLKSPSSGAKRVELKPVFQWGGVAGADAYELLVSTDVYFTNLIIERVGDFALPTTVWQCDTSLDYDTTYYWKVRAIGSNTHGAWSAVSAFTTKSLPASEPPAPPPTPSTAPNLHSPEAGASGVGVKPVFQWSAIGGADTYELLVSVDVSFTNLVIERVGDYALPTIVWQCDIGLDYDTTYYWKVRAIGANANNAWSAVSIFTTESPPSSESLSPAPIQPPSPPSAPPPAQPTTPEWVIYLMGFMGFIIVLLLIAIVVLVIRMRQSQL